MNHHLSEIKLYILNAFAIGLSFTNVELALKIVSLGLAAGYTARRWWIMEKNHTKNNNNDEI